MTQPVDGRSVTWVAEAIGWWQSSYRWSLRGHTPSPQLLADLLWSGVAAHTVVSDESGRPVALLQLYDLDLHNGVGALGLLVAPHPVPGLEGAIADFIERCFHDFPMRKVTVELVEDEFDDVAALGPNVRCAGVLRHHERRSEDEYANVRLYEIWPTSAGSAHS